MYGLLAIVCVHAQSDTIKTIDWDQSTNINPYEEPDNLVFDFSKVQERYRKVLEEMNNLSTSYKSKIIISQNKLKKTPNNKSLYIYLKNIQKESRNLQHDIDFFVKIYNRNGVSIKLHKANKKYADKYLNGKRKTLQNLTKSAKVSSPLAKEKEVDQVDFSRYHNRIRNSYESYPSVSCDVLYNGVDKVSMQQRKQLVSHPFFYYTHPKLRSYYKDQSFLEGVASLMELGSYTFVTFKIVIKSKDAKRNYGEIEENSMMRIKTISGELLYLPALKNSNSSINKETGFTEYYVAFVIDKENKRALRKYDIDKIGIMWTSGFEEYEIYSVDLIKEQLNCLQKL